MSKNKSKILKKVEEIVEEKKTGDIPFFPDNAPFSSNQKQWISGFLAGIKENLNNKNFSKETEKIKINFLYGTQTGNSESLARNAADLASKNNFDSNLLSLDDVSMDQLKEMEKAVFVISTYGEGEMPDGAQLFWESLSSEIAPKLNNLSFGVISLGDTSYEMFCNAGKLLDFRLEQLGAKRVSKRIDCDVDYEIPSNEWLKSTLPSFGGLKELNVTEKNTKDELFSWSKKNPYFAEISANLLLSGNKSNKEIRHYEIELAESGIRYEVGDTLNVFPTNSRKLVGEILEKLKLNNNFKPSGFQNTIHYLLMNKYEILSPSKDLVNYILGNSKINKMQRLLESGNSKEFDSFLWGKDVLDLLNLDDNASIPPEEFLSLLKPLQPRAYSISSSQKMYKDQVHLTVSTVKWEYSQRVHEGVCSNFLSNSEETIDNAGIFLSQNQSFRLPEDNSIPIIMIGPGTGVAPFRAFLQDRRLRGGNGKNWLFFGDQTRNNDFIYEKEINDFKKDGILTNLDLAFSRDQKEKIYVQHRMLESSKELFDWIENGAYVYVCGDANYMARDVDKALYNLIQKSGNLNDDKTNEYMNDLKREKRYLRDIY
tara:strand:+ start:5402 stop:7192 length:1791 start_codon:yes stop_codon:yes gene_type:complete